MRWADGMSGRADLMRRMLGTIGAMDRMPEGMCMGQDLRTAMQRCACCGESENCQKWIEEHSGEITRAPDLCPNAALFNSWLGQTNPSCPD